MDFRVRTKKPPIQNIVSYYRKAECPILFMRLEKQYIRPHYSKVCMSFLKVTKSVNKFKKKCLAMSHSKSLWTYKFVSYNRFLSASLRWLGHHLKMTFFLPLQRSPATTRNAAWTTARAAASARSWRPGAHLKAYLHNPTDGRIRHEMSYVQHDRQKTGSVLLFAMPNVVHH
jgi:hypothetical protein